MSAEGGRLPSANLAVSRYEFSTDCIVRLLGAAPSPVVFDIGAGDGRLAAPTRAAGGSWQGFDLRTSLPEIRAWNLELPCPTEGAAAGIVLLLDVIEHLVNPGCALGNIGAVLPSGGFLVLTTPNPRWSRSRIHALFHGVPACFTEMDLERNGHVFTPWPHILMKMLDGAGFDIEDYVTLDGRTGWPERPITLRYPLRLGHAMLNMLIERLDSSACGMSYGLIASKRWA